MLLYQGLDLDLNKGELVSLIGGIGKTTSLFDLAKELKALGKKLLVTTSTSFKNPRERDYDYYFLGDMDNFNPQAGTITVYGEKLEDGDLIGPKVDKIDEINSRGIFDFILVEADDSQEKSIKGHLTNEPIVPRSTTLTVGFVGIDAIGKSILEAAHRPEEFAKITGLQLGAVIEEETVVQYIIKENGLFKNIQGKKILLLNKAYNDRTILLASSVRRALFAEGYKDMVMVGDIRRKKMY